MYSYNPIQFLTKTENSHKDALNEVSTEHLEIQIGKARVGISGATSPTSKVHGQNKKSERASSSRPQAETSWSHNKVDLYTTTLIPKKAGCCVKHKEQQNAIIYK